jgi:hypothetical protein
LKNFEKLPLTLILQADNWMEQSKLRTGVS